MIKFWFIRLDIVADDDWTNHLVNFYDEKYRSRHSYEVGSRLRNGMFSRKLTVLVF